MEIHKALKLFTKRPFHMLLAIYENRNMPLTITKTSMMVGLTEPNGSIMLKKLENYDLIKIKKVGRERRIFLTKDGLELAKKLTRLKISLLKL